VNNLGVVRSRFGIAQQLIVLILVLACCWQSARADVPSQYRNALEDAGYDVYSGDINGDGKPDLLLKAKHQFVFVDYEILIPVLLRWRNSFVVLSNSDGTYTIQVPPTAAMLASTVWQSGTHELIFGDTDGDGSTEMLIRAKTTGNVSILITSSSTDGIPTIRQRLNASDLGGTDLGAAGLDVDLLDTNGDGRADLMTAQGVMVQSIYLSEADGTFPANPSPVVFPTVAGSTPGQLNVSNTGAATYDIPIWMPGGPNGVQPSLALHYDSRREQGIVGPGWAISGLGAIYRCNKTYAQDTSPAPVALAAGDGYCLDGGRLRLTGGTYGADSSTYETETADFSQAMAYNSTGNGPGYFFVRGKNGLIYEYGNSNDGGASNTARITASGSSTAYQWRLNKVRDRNGNNYIVTYGTGQSGSAGIGVPLSISYTPTSSGAGTYRYSVTFTYMADTPDGTESGYVAGGRTINNNLLTRVEIKRLDVSKSLRTYAIGYERSPTTNRNRLASVQECSDSGLTSCLSPTVVGYQDGSAGVSSTSNTALTGTTSVKGVYDFDGDGRQDILYQSGSTLYVAFATSSGYGAPVSTGITLASSDYYDVGDLVATGKDDILVTRSGVWYRYFWTGSAFSGVSTGMALGSDELVIAPFLIDLNGDGLLDLITGGTTFVSGSTAITTSLYSRLSTSTGSLSFSSTRSVAYSACSSCSRISSETGRGSAKEKLDFNGDGRDDIAFTAVSSTVPNTTYFLVSTGTALQLYGQISSSTVPVLLNWNDDNCTDSVADGYVKISGCNGISSQAIQFSGTYLGVMDWNGDGRTDLLVNSGGNIGVYLSTGGGIGNLIATTIPASSNLMVLDQNGDGLDDIGNVSATSPYPVTYRLHNGAGTPPDLVTSITTGYGVAFNPAYTSIVQGSYSKGSGAAYPQRDIQRPMYVVKQLQASDGAGGVYTKSYAYGGGRENVQGRGFSGFGSVTVSDNRSNAPVVKTYYQIPFPYTGMPYQRDVYQNNGTTLISHTLNTPAQKILSSTANQQRYFPYIASSATDVYEVGGSKNGLLIRKNSASFVFDDYGNVTSSTTTQTDKDSATPQSPTYNQSWTTTVTNTIAPDTANWCLGIPTQTTVTRAAGGVATITRTASFTPDYAKCRISQSIVEPSSATYKVTTDYLYDSFGNINSQTVTGIGMTARTTTATWGTTGQFPITVTNAMFPATDPSNQTITAGYDYNLGVRTSITDANGFKTTWSTDAFGRVQSELRPDGTLTSYAYNKCADVSGGCQNGDPTNGNTSINKLVVVATAKDVNGNALRDDWTYLDQFERPIVSKSKTLGGGYSRVGSQYDGYGRLYRQTAPCDSVACSLYWTTNSYDAVGRPVQQSRWVSAADSSTQTTTASYQGLTTVITDPQFKTTTKAVDPNGWLRQSKDHDGYYQAFAYDAFGSLKTVTDSQSNALFSANYDYGVAAFRRQTSDVDLGTWNYTPNALGEVTNYTDANANAFTLSYDKLSRPLTRFVSGEGTTTWTWGSSAASYNIGQLQSLTSTGGTAENYSYDSKGRLSQRQIVSDATYNYNLAYNSTTGYLDTLTYPISTGSYRLKLQYGYQNGQLNQISNYSASSTVYWQATAMNPRFQVTQETLGNGIVTNSGFDAVTGRLATIQSGIGGGSGVQNEAYQYDKLGNLIQRQNLAASLTETFAYDNLYRLDYSKLNGTTNLDLSYNALGNITARCEPTCGSTWTYDANKKHAVTQASVGSTAYSYGYDSNGNVTTRNGYSITWSKYNYPTLINGPNESISLDYDASFQRWRQVDTLNGVSETTIYAGGMLEKVISGGTTDWRHSIVANGKTVAIYSRNSGGTNSLRYMLEDHQGSIAKITNSAGATIVAENFTAFGARRNPATWSGAPSSGDLTTIASVSRDGYTGHTALGNMGLNHMNGRVQDALTGRFLSADPHISQPGNTQGFNRYSYVNNNPLTLIDPTGFDDEPVVLPTITVNGAEDTGDYLYDAGSDVIGWAGGVVGSIVSDVFGGLFGGGHKPPPPPAQASPDDNAPCTSGACWFSDPTVGGCAPADPCLEHLGELNAGMGYARPQPGLFDRGGAVDRVVGNVVTGLLEHFVLNPAVIFAPFGAPEIVATEFGAAVTAISPGRTVIGKLADLKSLGSGERTLLDRLPNLGNPRANWLQNSSVLRQELRIGQPIRDASVDAAGRLINNTGFLRAERNLLENQGWIYDSAKTFWFPPVMP
jgi:RHS repeat-associated protein